MTNTYGFQEVEPEFLEVMTATVRIFQPGPPDVYGKITQGGTATEVPCHYDEQGKSYTTPTGETRQITGRVFLGWIVPWLTTAARIDVPDLSSPTGWKTTIALSVDAVYGPAGVHHQELTLGPRGQGEQQ